MNSQTSNPFSTGGGGHFFETKVQASFLLNLLIEGFIPCLTRGKIVSVRLQAKQAGFNTDDVLVKIHTNKGVEHQLLGQIKHQIAITANDENFKDALKSAWLDFNNQTLFNQGRDAIAIITGPLPDQVLRHMRPLLDWSRTSATCQEFVGKVATAHFSSDKKRDYLKVFRDVLSEIAEIKIGDEQLWQFLRHFYLLSFDFDVQGSKDEASILTILDLARSPTGNLDPRAIWEALIVQAQEFNKTAGTITPIDLPERLRTAVHPQRSPKQRETISKLREHCDFILRGIRIELAPGITLPRKAVLDVLIDAVESSRIVVVQGPPGSGKSALVKMLFEALPSGILPFAFKAQEFNKPHIHQFLSSMGIDLTVAQLRSEFALLPRKIMLIDGAERIFELNNYEAFRHLLQELSKDSSWTVVITCRESSAQELREHLLSQWETDVIPVLIPPLNSAELAWVIGKAPHLAPLIANQRLAKLLCLPFILWLAWKAFPTPTSAETGSNIDEDQFKDIVWRDYVERVGQAPRALQIKRGQCLISVSVERAKRMSLFVPPGDRDADALSALVDDGILITSKQGGYAPDHDVLEDWAVSRFIDQEFDAKAGNPAQFIEAIGTEPAMRRNFRLWLSEALMGPKKQRVVDFVSSRFQNADLSSLWLDEIAISVLQSDYAGEFIGGVQKLLLEENRNLYRRLVHVLRTACKGPNETLLQNLGMAAFQNHIALNSLFVIPIGSGWREIIQFTSQNLEAFDLRDAHTILGLLKDWSQGLLEPLPSESEAVAKICLKYWELLTVPNLYAGDLAEEFLEVLFKIPQAVPIQVEALIRSALDNHLAGNHHSRTILKRVVRSLDSHALCLHFPNLVIEVAEKTWRMQSGHRRRLAYRFELEEMFGFTHLGHSEYFPPSALQGPFTFLLTFHPDLAVDFIVQFVNEAATAYSQSGLDGEINKISITTESGVHPVLASPRLWVLYRGMMPGPNILECALMALEAWLLSRAKEGKDIRETFRRILKSSTSVATLAVLSSVAVAYPSLLGEEALPLLQCEEFFRWDFQRAYQEKTHPVDIRPMMGIPTGGIEDIYYQERQKQAGFPHRTSHLEQLVTHLQLTPIKERIWSILDKFKKALPPEEKQNENDKSWRIALHRMDIRNYEASQGKEPDEVILTSSEPALDLQQYLKKSAEEYALTEQRLKLAMWGRTRFNRETQAFDPFPEWKDALREAQGFWENRVLITDDISVANSGPAFVAAYLIRDHFAELKAEDIDWCRRVIFEEVLKKDAEIDESKRYAKNPFDGSRPSAYVLPLLLPGELNAKARKQIEECLVVAVSHGSEEVRDYAAAGIRNWLWDIDPELATVCVGGILSLGEIENRIRNEQRSRAKYSREEEEKAILEATRKLRISMAQGEISAILSNPEIDLDKIDWPELQDAITMIRPDTSDSTLTKLIMVILFALIGEAEANETGKSGDRREPHYELQHVFASYFAQFALARSIQEAAKLGEILGHTVDKCPEFLCRLLEKFPHEEDRIRSNEVFWNIWRKVSEPIFFHSSLRGSIHTWRYDRLRKLVRTILFADLKWKEGVKEWEPVTENRQFFENAATAVGNTKAGFGAFLFLLSSVGQVFLPEAIIWLHQNLKKIGANNLLDNDDTFQLEILLRKVCYEWSSEVRQRPELHNAVIALLDVLVDRGSHTGFRLRDFIVSPVPMTS